LGGVPKEVGFIGSHGLRHLLIEFGAASILEEGAQIIQGGEVELLDKGAEPAFEKIVFVVFKNDTDMVVDVVLKEPVVLRENLRIYS
jgi:hypothetical protein